MDCKVVDQKLVAHHFFEDHLAGCAACRESYAEVRRAMTMAAQSDERPRAHVKARLKALRPRPLLLVAAAGLATVAAIAAALHQTKAPRSGHGRPVDTAREIPLNLDTL